MAHNLIARARKETVPIAVIAAAKLDGWFKALPKAKRDWLRGAGFTGHAGSSALIPSETGGVEQVIFVIDDASDLWSWSRLASQLPSGSYKISGRLAKTMAHDVAQGWGMAAYEFTRYRKARLQCPELVWPGIAAEPCDSA